MSIRTLRSQHSPWCPRRPVGSGMCNDRVTNSRIVANSVRVPHLPYKPRKACVNAKRQFQTGRAPDGVYVKVYVRQAAFGNDLFLWTYLSKLADTLSAIQPEKSLNFITSRK
ncbi:hypothetical protein ACNJX9_39355 [Bradyrhizobium sp. DASA03076]|uniref:hypothetical protein n=1 Tax=Bradyrhizobium sp. BLXBL-03 TaxID=3395916 RepID=UPI003F6F1880